MVHEEAISMSLIPFYCREKIGRKYEEWDGYIKRFHNYGSHYEIYIESRSSFIIIFGNYINIYFPEIKLQL